jgi:hypothetical protein
MFVSIEFNANIEHRTLNFERRTETNVGRGFTAPAYVRRGETTPYILLPFRDTGLLPVRTITEPQLPSDSPPTRYSQPHR